jgi:hypothetical protein
MSMRRDLSHLGGIFEDRNLEGDEMPTKYAPGFDKEVLAEALKRYGSGRERSEPVGADQGFEDGIRCRR